MVVVNSSNDKCRNEEEDDSKKNINYSNNQKRKDYTYIGFAFMILAVVSITYLVMTLYGPFQPPLSFYDSVYNEREFDGYSGKDIILVCCSWGEELADGELTYFIGANIITQGQNNLGENVDSGSIEAVTRAIQEWNSKIERLTFTETSERRNADIVIYIREGGNERAGITKNYYDSYGLITKSYVIISNGAFGFGFSDNQIEQIANHEIGHVLGLGHANFDGNLMAVQVNRGSGSVDDCEIEAVYKANEWWFDKSDDGKLSYIQPPTTEHVECNN
jgi:hypothetical protein